MVHQDVVVVVRTVREEEVPLENFPRREVVEQVGKLLPLEVGVVLPGNSPAEEGLVELELQSSQIWEAAVRFQNCQDAKALEADELQNSPVVQAGEELQSLQAALVAEGLQNFPVEPVEGDETFLERQLELPLDWREIRSTKRLVLEKTAVLFCNTKNLFQHDTIHCARHRIP